MSMDTIAADGTAESCTLVNRVFTLFTNVAFRRSATDGTPMMTMMLGDRQAGLPIYALQREFSIDDASPDGRMLDLVVQSLDFVSELHLGDTLPREVIDGRASWAPGDRHREVARSRLQRGLLAWLERERGTGVASADASALRTLEDDEALRDRVAVAMRQAAALLNLRSSQDVLTLVEELAEELSYIEALRERLLVPIQTGLRSLAHYSAGFHGDGNRGETLVQVRRLTEVAAREIAARFDEVDGQTGEILAALRNPEAQRTFIRSNRDWLYRNLRAWETTLQDWRELGRPLDDAAWLIVGRSYHFLARRYMPTQEWIAAQAPRPARKAKMLGKCMEW